MKEVILVSRLDSREVECLCTKCGTQNKKAVERSSLATYRVNGQVSTFVGSKVEGISCSGCNNKEYVLVPGVNDITFIDLVNSEDLIKVDLYSKGIEIINKNNGEAISVQQVINVGLLNIDLVPKEELIKSVKVCKHTSNIAVLADHCPSRSPFAEDYKQIGLLTEQPAYFESFTKSVTLNVAMESFLYSVPVDVKLMIAEELASKLDAEVRKKFKLEDFSWMKDQSMYDNYLQNEVIASLYLLTNFPIFQQLNSVVRISSMQVLESDLDRLRQATSLLEFTRIFVPAIAEEDLEKFLQLRFVAYGEANTYFERVNSMALGMLEKPEQVSKMLDYILADNTQVALATIADATNNNAASIKRTLNQVFSSDTAYWDSFSDLFQRYEENVEYQDVVSKQEIVAVRFRQLSSIVTSLKLARKRANELAYLVGNFEETDIYKRLKGVLDGELKDLQVGDISVKVAQISTELSKEQYEFKVDENKYVFEVKAILLKNKEEQPTDMILTLNKETKELTCKIRGIDKAFNLAKVFAKAETILYFEANIYRAVYANLPMAVLEKMHDILLDGLYEDVINKFNLNEVPNFSSKFANRFEFLTTLHQLPMFAMFDSEADFFKFRFTEEQFEEFKAASSELEAMKVFIPNVTKKSMNVLKQTIATENRNGARRLTSVGLSYFGLLENGDTIYNLAKFVKDYEQFINPATEITGYVSERDLWKVSIAEAKSILGEYLLPGSLDNYINHVLSDKSFLASCQFEEGYTAEEVEEALDQKRYEAIRDLQLIIVDSVMMAQKFKNSLLRFEERLGKGIQMSAFLMSNYESAKELLAKRGTFKSIKKLHDALIEMSWNLKFETHEYKCPKHRLALEGTHNGYEFYLPRNTEELVKSARQLKICIAGYEDKLLSGVHGYVLVRKDGIDVFCIEVDGYNAFVESKKRNNKLLSLENEADKPLINAVQQFVTHHNLYIFNTDLDGSGIVGNQDEIPEEMY